MFRSPKHPVLGLALFLVLASAASSGVIEEQFPASSGGKLVVDTDFGALTVRSGDSDTIQVRVEMDSKAEDRLVVEFKPSPEGLTVLAKDSRRGLGSWWGSTGKAKFEFTVPRVYDISLDTSGGSIVVENIDGTVRVDTSGGSIRLGEIDGPVWADTSGGSIELERSQGDAELSTSGGHIRIGEVDGQVRAETSGGSIEIDRAGGEVRAQTSGGSIRVSEVRGTVDASTSGGSVHATLTEQPLGDCRLETSGGRVTLRLAEGIALDLDASSSGGGVDVDLPVEVRGSYSRNRLEGQINGGGPRMRLRSSGGGVSVEPL